LENSGGFGGENAGGDFDLMIEAGVRKDFETGMDGAAFRIVGAVDQARDAGLDDGSGAHAAGFDGDVEGRAGETMVAKKTRGLAEDEDFGVSGGIVVADGAVAGTSEDFPVMNEDGADGNFADRSGGVGFGEGLLHEFEVRFHLGRENSMGQRKERINTENAESIKVIENIHLVELRCLRIDDQSRKAEDR
jgi:hypothetical protein